MDGSVMEDKAARGNENVLNNQFFDSSGPDSSGSGVSETTSNEMVKLLQSIRKINFSETRVSAKKDIPMLSTTQQGKMSPQSQAPSSLGDSTPGKLPRKIFESCPCSCTRRFNETPEGSKSFRFTKVLLLVVFWILCTAVLIKKQEKVSNMHQLSIPGRDVPKTKGFWITEKPEKDIVSVTLEGAFLPTYYGNMSTRALDFWIEAYEFIDSTRSKNSKRFSESNIQNIRSVSDVVTIPIVSEHLLDMVPDLAVKNVVELANETLRNDTYLRIRFLTNLRSSFPISLRYDLSPVEMEHGVIYAALVLLFLYMLIIFEVLHRTLAGLLAAAMAVAILAALDERPTVTELASWMDFETLLLLFSMMVLVAVFSETGIFDYMSVSMYRFTSGRIWPLLYTIGFFTLFVSSFMDNVTTALLMTPITIRLCEVTELNPIPVLMAMSIFSNIGGAITPVGDPPNVIIATNPDVVAAGVTFSVFFLHMSIGTVIVVAIVAVYLRLAFSGKNVFGFEEPRHVQDLKQEIAAWERAAASLSSYSKNEDNVKENLLRRVQRMLCELNTRRSSAVHPDYGYYKKTLDELIEKYPIKNKALLFKSILAIVFVVTVFLLHSVPGLHLSLGCTAFMGALLLLILAERPHLEGILARVEWCTLIFFASLFILMEALSRLRLIEWIGQQTQDLIMGVEPEYQLVVAIVLILWVSAAVSAFVDNIPLTTMMIRIITSLANNVELSLPLLPLVWALCFGACLGGVATLIGSSSNVVCAGIAEQHGYRFTFIQYSKLGFPISILSLMGITAYLIIVHVLLQWNT